MYHEYHGGMFAKKHRYSFKEGLPKKTKSFPSFSLRYQSNDLGKARIAVVVSKRVHKNASTRNRIKRMLMEHLESKIDKNRGFDLVFFVKKRALDIVNFEDEVEQIIDLMGEI